MNIDKGISGSKNKAERDFMDKSLSPVIIYLGIALPVPWPISFLTWVTTEFLNRQLYLFIASSSSIILTFLKRTK